MKRILLLGLITIAGLSGCKYRTRGFPRGHHAAEPHFSGAVERPEAGVSRGESKAPKATPPDDNSFDEKENALDVINRTLEDAFFDFDKYHLRDDAREALARSVQVLARLMAADASMRLLIEGHCDERGSSEYNLALGQLRAEKAKEFLATLGLPPGRVEAVSFGKERPQCTESTEQCWQKNRRAHLRDIKP